MSNGANVSFGMFICLETRICLLLLLAKKLQKETTCTDGAVEESWIVISHDWWQRQQQQCWIHDLDTFWHGREPRMENLRSKEVPKENSRKKFRFNPLQDVWNVNRLLHFLAFCLTARWRIGQAVLSCLNNVVITQQFCLLWQTRVLPWRKNFSFELLWSSLYMSNTSSSHF